MASYEFHIDTAPHFDVIEDDPMQYGAVADAIQRMHETAHEPAETARRVMADYDMVTELGRACQPASRSQDLLLSLRNICAVTSTPVRFKDLCHLGLMHAFVAIIEHLASFERPSRARRHDRNLKLTMICLKTIVDANDTFYRYARSAGLSMALSHLLCTVPLSDHVSATICTVLSSCMRGRHYEADIVYDMHSSRCMRGLLVHLRSETPHMRLMSSMLQNGMICHFVLHEAVRAAHLIGHLVYVLETFMCTELRHFAGRSLCLLLIFDPVRTSMYMNQVSDCSQFLMRQLEASNLMLSAVQVISATLGIRSMAIDQYQKQARRTSPSARNIQAQWWIDQYGGRSLMNAVTHALLITKSNELHAVGSGIVEKLCQCVVYTAEECSFAVSAMVESINSMVQSNNTTGAQTALSAITHLLRNGRLSVANNSLRTAVRQLTMLFGIKFDFRCRNKHFISVRTLPNAEDCSICANTYDDSAHLAMRTHCNHEFCKVCLERWLLKHSSNTSCPECRSSGVDIVAEVLGHKLGKDAFFSGRHTRLST